MIPYVQRYNVCAMPPLEQFSVEFLVIGVVLHFYGSNWFKNLAPFPTPVRR